MFDACAGHTGCNPFWKEIRKLRLNRTPTGRHLGSSVKNTNRRLPMILVPFWLWPDQFPGLEKGGAWHFWKSEEQPVKASQPSQASKVSVGRTGATVDEKRGSAVLGYNFTYSRCTHTHGVYNRAVVDNACEGLPFGLGKLKHIAATLRFRWDNTLGVHGRNNGRNRLFHRRLS